MLIVILTLGLSGCAHFHTGKDLTGFAVERNNMNHKVGYIATYSEPGFFYHVSMPIGPVRATTLQMRTEDEQVD